MTIIRDRKKAIAESIKRERKTGRLHYVYQENYGYEVVDRKRRPPEPPDPNFSCLSLFKLLAAKAYYGKS